MDSQNEKRLKALQEATKNGMRTGKQINRAIENNLGVKLGILESLGLSSAASVSHSVSELASLEEEALNEWLED